MKKYIIFVTIVVLTITSCQDDLLDTVPKSSIPEAIAYNTPERLLAQVNNLYKQLQNQSFYGGRFIIFNEQRADQFGQNDGNAATGSAVWNQNVASTNDFVNNVWSVAYTAINASNILISKLSTTTVVSEAQSKAYTAEAKYVRAFCYLSLIQTYAQPYSLDKNGLGLPLRLLPITSSGYNDLARSTIEEVYIQIIKDLDEAEKDIPEEYATPLLTVSRATKATVIALKTRVYLIENNYEKVIAESQKIVSPTAPFEYKTATVTRKLETAYTSLYGGSYLGGEAIFSIPFANTTTETPNAQFSLAFNYVSQPILFLTAAGISTDSALNSPSDARSSLITTNKANQKILKKFNVTTAPFRDYVPVIRYAEVLLNYAEAAANQGDLTKAISLLKAVRNRADATYVFPDADINTQKSLIATILKERDIEFLGEGIRLMDLQRRLQTLPAKKGSIGTAPEVLVGSSNYIWPIPSGEMAANKLMQANP